MAISVLNLAPTHLKLIFQIIKYIAQRSTLPRDNTILSVVGFGHATANNVTKLDYSKVIKACWTPCTSEPVLPVQWCKDPVPQNNLHFLLLPAWTPEATRASCARIVNAANNTNKRVIVVFIFCPSFKS
jgi:hypothetical protein